MTMPKGWVMSTEHFNSWPTGFVPPEKQRPELDQVRQAGYEWSDPRDVIDIFERKVAAFAGAQYGVAVDCCSHGVFLCLKYLQATGVVNIPKHTYQSIPMQISHAGCKVQFRDEEWSGVYQVKPYPVWDAATRWHKGMYQGGLYVTSFQMKKRVPIGRGGMILTDDVNAVNWLQRARYDGRDLGVSQWDDEPEIMGWHYYMTPEDAARGILLMDQTPLNNPDTATWQNYADLSTKKLFQGTHG
jgi:dTDP-4-amino-4,6-dideoxygalactose transaminase